MIYLIIGGSCCGKTSFVKNTWLGDASCEVKKDLLTYVETDSAILLGKYENIDGRERAGTDTISRSQICLIERWVEKVLCWGKDIVIEGDKATSRKLFEALLHLCPIQLILIHCDIGVSLCRNRKENTIVKTSTLKAILTKAKNIYLEYKDKMNGFDIDTTLFSPNDFRNFSLYNYWNYTTKSDTNKLF